MAKPTFYITIESFGDVLTDEDKFFSLTHAKTAFDWMVRNVAPAYNRRTVTKIRLWAVNPDGDLLLEDHVRL